MVRLLFLNSEPENTACVQSMIQKLGFLPGEVRTTASGINWWNFRKEIAKPDSTATTGAKVKMARMASCATCSRILGGGEVVYF